MPVKKPKNKDQELLKKKLLKALQTGNLVRVKKILKQGIDPNCILMDHYTPLQIALRKNKLLMVKMLLAAGADPARANDLGFTPLMVANSYADFPIRDLLMQKLHGKKLSKKLLEARQLMLAACNNDVRKIAKIIKKVKNPDLPYLQKISALMVAVQAKKRKAIKCLLEAGADVNYKSSIGGSALITAAGMGDLTIVRDLVERGAQINQMTVRGITPLTHAILKQDLKIINYLLLRGANPNFHNMKFIPIGIAWQLNNKKIINKLYAFGAKPL